MDVPFLLHILIQKQLYHKYLKSQIKIYKIFI